MDNLRQLWCVAAAGGHNHGRSLLNWAALAGGRHRERLFESPTRDGCGSDEIAIRFTVGYDQATDHGAPNP